MPQRLPRLLAHGFGLWDVLGACERKGSLDSRNPQARGQRLRRMHELCPQLETVGFNGQASGKFALQFAEAGYRTVVLPSTSPAYAAMSFAQKLAVWYELGAGYSWMNTCRLAIKAGFPLVPHREYEYRIVTPLQNCTARHSRCVPVEMTSSRRPASTWRPSNG